MADNILGKEKNFVSAVVYLHNDNKTAVSFFDALYKVLIIRLEIYKCR